VANLSDSDVATAALLTWGNVDDAVTATAISFAEDPSHDPLATHVNSNGTTDYGLWQINSVHSDLLKEWDWKNPRDNSKMAFNIWQAAGGKWTPWSTYPAASSLRMNQAHTAVMDAVKRAASTPSQSLWDQISMPLNMNAFGSAAETVGSATDFLSQVGTFFSKLGDPKFWTSVGVVLAGGIMLIFVAIHLLKNSDIGKGTAKIATKVAEVAAVA
jgi:hypothetical protein